MARGRKIELMHWRWRSIFPALEIFSHIFFRTLRFSNSWHNKCGVNLNKKSFAHWIDKCRRVKCIPLAQQRKWEKFIKTSFSSDICGCCECLTIFTGTCLYIVPCEQRALSAFTDLKICYTKGEILKVVHTIKLWVFTCANERPMTITIIPPQLHMPT